MGSQVGTIMIKLYAKESHIRLIYSTTFYTLACKKKELSEKLQLLGFHREILVADTILHTFMQNCNCLLY